MDENTTRTEQEEQLNATDNKPSEDKSIKTTILMYLHDFVSLLAGVLLVFLLLFRIVTVDGISMKDTFVHGDYLLLLSSVFYTEPQQGDIIVASKDNFEDGAPIIKRVIATEGQTVDIDFTTGLVYVDGVALDEPYTKTPTNLKEGIEFPLTVESGCVFAMGDYRNRSKDSRSIEIGLIDTREIIGKAIFLCYPGAGEDGDEFDISRIGVIS